MTGILGALNYQRKSGQFTLTKEEFNIVNLVVHGVSTNGRRVLNEAEMNHLKVDLLDYQDFIKKNNVEEITDTLLFIRDGYPAPKGLLSQEIFGITKDDRANIFGYIDLHGWFMHPFCYKVWCSIDKRIRNIVSGIGFYKVDQDGLIQEVQSGGDTGIEFLRKNINKIKIKETGTRTRSTKIQFLYKCKKMMFLDKFLVIPPFYRDMDTKVKGAVGAGGINKYYQSLIISSKAIQETQDYGLSIENTTNARIQETLLNISNALFGTSKNKDDGIGLAGKTGIIREAVLSKSTDMGTRLVLSAPDLKVEAMEDLMVDTDHAALPLASALVNFKPFIIFQAKRLFENLFQNVELMQVYDPKAKKLVPFEPKDPLITFSDEEIDSQIDKFIFSFSKRLEPVTLTDQKTGRTLGLVFKGKKVSKARYAKTGGDIMGESSLINRPLTWCDVLYMAACEACKDKTILITRFPMDSYFNEFPILVRISTIKETEKIYVNNTYYPFYPKIRESDIGSDTSNKFIDTLVFSNVYLKSIGGDYDGDQCSVKAVWSEEANRELREQINSKAVYIDLGGNNIKVSTNEAVQAIYNLTKILNEDKVKLTDPKF